jgi:hypothetical protein
MTDSPTTRMLGDHRFIGMSAFCDKCGRRESDILSYAPIAKVGDAGISCAGNVTDSELASYRDAYEKRLRTFDMVMS